MIPDRLDRKRAQLVDTSSQTAEQFALHAMADRVRLAEHVKSVIQASAAHDDGQRLTAALGDPMTFQTLLNVELERMTLSASRNSASERKKDRTSMDTSILRSAATGEQPQHSTTVGVDQLARQWQSVVGAKSAVTSRPVGVVENQLIIEVTPDTPINGAELARAIRSLGRADVDRVAIRVVNTVHDRQAQTQSQRQGLRR